jgi:hypothetical protein
MEVFAVGRATVYRDTARAPLGSRAAGKGRGTSVKISGQWLDRSSSRDGVTGQKGSESRWG